MAESLEYIQRIRGVQYDVWRHRLRLGPIEIWRLAVKTLWALHREHLIPPNG